LSRTHEFSLFTRMPGSGNIRFHERPGNVRARQQPPSAAITLVFMEKHR
jgi:hypothetical protein